MLLDWFVLSSSAGLLGQSTRPTAQGAVSIDLNSTYTLVRFLNSICKECKQVMTNADFRKQVDVPHNMHVHR